jgi:hypothetical protein
MKTVKKTTWIVARYEVFWPTLNLEQGPVLTKPRSGKFRFRELKTSPAFRDRFQVK